MHYVRHLPSSSPLTALRSAPFCLTTPLDIETRQSGTKRRHTEYNFVFRRLVDASGVGSNSTANKTPSGLFQVLATQPKVEGNGIQNDAIQPEEQPAATSRSTAVVSAPREFHLSRAELNSPQPVPNKRRKSAVEPSVAVFVEATPHDAMDTSSASEARPTVETASSPSVPAPSLSPRKRPGTAASRSKMTASKELSKEADATATHAAMQQHAEELDKAQTAHSEGSIQRGVEDSTEMDTSSDDYVYDTYERYQNVHPQPAGKDGDASLSIAGATPPVVGQTIGYLVIMDEDQTLWESYYDSDANSSDERDWDSEQDDENAENYYGADYPEEEVNSDDEMGHNAYRYRKGSDDEEFGSEDSDWSDDEDGMREWRRAASSSKWASNVGDDSDEEA